MKKLLILTVEWPYGKGETFFGNESVFAHGFDKVYCMPLFCNNNKKEIPHNICLINSNTSRVENKYYYKSFTQKVFWEEVKGIIKQKKKIIIRLKCLIRHTGISLKRVDLLTKWIEGNISEEDEITIYTYWMASDATAASMLKKRGVPISKIVTRCHGFDLYEEINEEGYLPYRKFIFENVDIVSSISENGYRYLKEKYDYLSTDKITISKLGTLNWGKNPEDSKCGEKCLSIVSCSSLIEIKRVDLMLEALQHVTVPVEWRHFGDGKLRNHLETMKENLPDYIHFNFMGSVPNNQLMEWYQNNHVDFFVNTSRSEGLPVSIMEAMSFGIPVIATNVGGTSEIVHDGYNGYLLNRDFLPSELAQIINSVSTLRPERILSLRMNARNSWENDYRAEINYKNFYDNILK